MSVAQAGLPVFPRQREKGFARDLARSQRRTKFKAFLLVAPLLLFLLLVFIGPLVMLLSRSVIDREVARALPQTLATLDGWSIDKPVPDAAYAALLDDLRKAAAPNDIADAASRLNFAQPGMRSLLMSTRARLQRTVGVDPRQALSALSPRWEEPATWAVIKQASGALTGFYLLAALDLKRMPDGSIARVEEGSSAFVPAIGRTFAIAFGVTGLVLIFGFPFAYLMTLVGKRMAGLMMLVVLLPFWTATMVRTLAWAILLGREGIVNDGLLGAGLVSRPLDLLYNSVSVHLALVHIFMPYMVLPLYSVMRTVPASHMRAAASLGATPWTVFRRIFLPQVVPGIAAGCLLVFIHSLGVFVVPALLGGPREQGLPVLIVTYVSKTPNWGLAAALSLILLVSVYVLYWLFVRLTKSTTLSVGA